MTEEVRHPAAHQRRAGVEKDPQLLFREGEIAIGVGEMCPKAFQLQVGIGVDVHSELDGLFGHCAEAMHAAVDLDVDADLGGRHFHQVKAVSVVDGEAQLRGYRRGQRGWRRIAEVEDRLGDAGLTELDAFRDG